MEGFAVISGTINSSSETDLITSIAKNRYASYKTAHHEWINNVEESEYRSALDKVRTDPNILKKIQEKFPSATIKSVTESDEIYWAVSPKGAVGSDRSLVDCHYDSPFAWFPTGGVVFYRVIIACNENNTVTTVFPDESVRVKMTNKDFHGLDYNKDIHCVEGQIPEGKFRVLLKMHYLVIPKGSESYAGLVRWLNVTWTSLSRETMRMSAEPKNWWENIVAAVVNISRIVFNHFYTTLFLVALVFLYAFKIRVFKLYKIIQKSITKRR
jgi:hypothetical protein